MSFLSLNDDCATFCGEIIDNRLLNYLNISSLSPNVIVRCVKMDLFNDLLALFMSYVDQNYFNGNQIHVD